MPPETHAGTGYFGALGGGATGSDSRALIGGGPDILTKGERIHGGSGPQRNSRSRSPDGKLKKSQIVFDNKADSKDSFGVSQILRAEEEEEEDETIESPFIGVHKVEDKEEQSVKNETPQWGKGGVSVNIPN